MPGKVNEMIPLEDEFEEDSGSDFLRRVQWRAMRICLNGCASHPLMGGLGKHSVLDVVCWRIVRVMMTLFMVTPSSLL
jgi:hypothetical protein